jgi:hypothetical protein
VTSISQLYLGAQASFVELYRTLEDDDLAKAVPCTPRWTVRDVLSHVAGVTDDIANGRIDGASTDPWTAAQVERWRDADPEMLIEQWNGQIGAIADVLDQIGEFRPALDCCSHEHDLRHALDRTDNQSSEIVNVTAEHFAKIPVGRPVAITFADGSTLLMPGDGEPIELDGLTQFEYVRSRLGRRTRAQVAAFSWSEAPSDDLLSEWFTFGPSELPIVETASRWG